MTTWTLEQVKQVRGLRAHMTVDAELVERHGDAARDAVATQMAKHLTRMAHTFAVELHWDDLEVQWSDVPKEPWHIAADMRWRPPTKTVELHGGHLDGQRYGLEHVGESIRVPKPAPFAWLPADLNPGDLVPDLADTYELVGWREDERVWVYATRQ